MMKSWHLLNQQLAIWRQKYHHQRSLLKNNQQPKTKLLWYQQKFSQKNWQKIYFCDSVVTLFLAIVLLTGVVGYRFYNQPQLTVGKVSPVTIKAPETASFEDAKTTLKKRQEVRTGVIPILKQNQKITSEINLNLNQYLATIENIRNLNKPFPFVNPQIISSEIQQYLRSCSTAEFDRVLQPLLIKDKTEKLLNSQELTQIELTKKAIAELKFYRQKNSNQDFLALLTKIKAARIRYTQGWESLQQQTIAEFSITEISPLLKISDRGWAETKNNLQTATERILTQGIPPGIPTEILVKVVDLQLGDRLSPAISNWSSKLLLELLRPNLEQDREATLNLAEKAAEEIEPITVNIEKGATIVTQGNVISQTDFVILDGFGLSRRSINWLGLQTSTTIVILAIAIFLFCQKQTYLTLRHRDYLLLCVLAISAPIIAIFQITHPNLPAIGLLISSFYHPLLAVCHVSLVTGLIFFSNPTVNWEYLLAASAGGLMTGAIAGRLRSREAISKLGVSVGLVQGGVYFLSKMIVSSSAGIIWSAVLPDAILYGLSGVAWCIVALGISPYLEKFFDVVTPIRLAELSNPNLPLLKRLATEAPGTFQHTMFVASLAESAARALNCNVELVRAGTLYHDIGKMHDPLGFIENQMGNPNKHDAIDDPWVSAEIIKKHVTEGLVMAKKYGLPKAIRDFIPQHQGTLLIAYFYHQAKQKLADNRDTSFLEADFRYDGPVPQSREAGIMMLADGCEAALRSLKDITPEQALTTVKKIFKARWQDRQLIDSGLKYEELPIIAEVFVRVWQQVNHKRIIYPKDSN